LNIIDDVLSRSKPNGVSEHPLTSKALDESTMQLISSEIGDFEEETPHPWWKRALIIMLVGALAGDILTLKSNEFDMN
jgi:hypothetical protein